MKNKYFITLFISLFVGFIVTVSISILSATYYEASPVSDYENIITGIDAVMITVNNIGVVGYLQGLIAPYLVYSLGVFISCIVNSKMNQNQRGN
jgi:hypothetical protein